MPVEPVYVILDGAPGPDSARFVEIETEERASVRVEAGFDPVRPDMWRIGPLFLRTGDPAPDFTEEIQVAARLAANDLIAIADAHEKSEHGGAPCMDNRYGIVAFVAHSLGLTPEHLPGVIGPLAAYDHGGHSHG